MEDIELTGFRENFLHEFNETGQKLRHIKERRKSDILLKEQLWINHNHLIYLKQFVLTKSMEKPEINLKPVMFNQGQFGFERRSLSEMI
jgi:hypothetical protein